MMCVDILNNSVIALADKVLQVVKRESRMHRRGVRPGRTDPRADSGRRRFIRGFSVKVDSGVGFRSRIHGSDSGIDGSDSGIGFKGRIQESNSGVGFRDRIQGSDSGIGFRSPIQGSSSITWKGLGFLKANTKTAEY